MSRPRRLFLLVAEGVTILPMLPSLKFSFGPECHTRQEELELDSNPDWDHFTRLVTKSLYNV